MKLRAVLLVAAALLAACDDAAAPPPNEEPAWVILVERWSGAAAPERLFVTIDPGTGEVKPFGPVPAPAIMLSPSPSGTRFSFLGATDHGLHLWTMNRNGTGLTDLFAGQNVDIHGAGWSPDASRIVYSQTGDGSEYDIWVMNANGTSRTNLTPDAGQGVVIDAFPQWSPDGSRIAFTSNESGVNRIWVMDADGTDKVMLPGQTTSDWAAWHPASDRVAYVSVLDPGFAVGISRLDGSDPQLFVQPGTVGPPAWTPDGQVLFIANPTGANHELMILDPATGNVRNLTNSAASETFAAILKRSN